MTHFKHAGFWRPRRRRTVAEEDDGSSANAGRAPEGEVRAQAGRNLQDQESGDLRASAEEEEGQMSDAEFEQLVSELLQVASIWFKNTDYLKLERLIRETRRLRKKHD